MSEPPVWIDEPDLNAKAEEKKRQKDRQAPNGSTSWTIPEAEILSLACWLKRDLPPPDFVLGEVVSTTSRILLVAATGLGKTHFGMAIGIAIANGSNFLHWNGCGRPRRVLYIDGEMSRRLLKQRLADAARRLGSIPDAFFALSREDCPDMPPLNTEKGQDFINAVIDMLGGVNLIILDNIQSLLADDDSFGAETWRQALPWVRDLSRREIGQIWIHHTGYDETHAWGTSTRDWQLDTVALLERVERPDADIAFKLSFSKARERTPDNRSDFDPAVISLADDQWISDRGGNLRTKRHQTHKSRALELLVDAIARGEGVIPPSCSRIPPRTLCLNETLWRKLFVAGSIAETPESADRAFRRAAGDLLNARQIEKWLAWIWPVRI